MSVPAALMAALYGKGRPKPPAIRGSLSDKKPKPARPTAKPKQQQRPKKKKKKTKMVLVRKRKAAPATEAPPPPPKKRHDARAVAPPRIVVAPEAAAECDGAEAQAPSTSRLVDLYATDYIGDPVTLSLVDKYIGGQGGAKPLLLRGPTGCGKGCAVYAAAKKHSFRVVEMTPSLYTSAREAVNETLQRSAGMFGAARPRVVLLRGADGYTDTELRSTGKKRAGLLDQIFDLLDSERASWPLVVTADTRYHRTLNNAAVKARFSVRYVPPVDRNQMMRFLFRVCKERGIGMQKRQMHGFALSFGGDARAMLNALETYRGGADVSKPAEGSKDEPRTDYSGYLEQFFVRRTAQPNFDHFAQNGVHANLQNYLHVVSKQDRSELAAYRVGQNAEVYDWMSEADAVRSSDFVIDTEVLAGVRAVALQHTQQVMAQRGMPTRRVGYKQVKYPRRGEFGAAARRSAALDRVSRAQATTCGYLPSWREVHDRLMVPETARPAHPKAFQRLETERMQNEARKVLPDGKLVTQARNNSVADRKGVVGAFKDALPECFRGTKVGAALRQQRKTAKGFFADM